MGFSFLPNRAQGARRQAAAGPRRLGAWINYTGRRGTSLVSLIAQHGLDGVARMLRALADELEGQAKG